MRIDIQIEGITPMICNRFTEARQAKASSGNSTTQVGDLGSPQEQAEERLYKDEKGNLVIPQPNIFSCIIEGGKFFKAGKSKITTIKSSLIPGCVEIEGVTIPIEYKDSWTVDSRPVRIPATGGRIICHRPIFNDWKLSFIVFLDTDIIGVKIFREIVDAAGRRIGLGDFRPACKGPFGRFVVTKWKEKELAKAA